MPELAEVETLRRTLEMVAPPGSQVVEVQVRRPDLRFPLPVGLAERLRGRTLARYRRHGKYLLWDLDGVTVLSHLGMSGSWRRIESGAAKPHDHLLVRYRHGVELAYHDPRRFGFLDLLEPGSESRHPRLLGLGPDALDPNGFGPGYLRTRLQGRTAAIKLALLDQRIVAGVGNIYACEALFRAGIRPGASAGRIGLARLERLVVAIRGVLEEAIAVGGSTLRDYVDANGQTGYFQHRFQVYGRAGQPCPSCRRTLRGAVFGGRATVWCATCQR